MATFTINIEEIGYYFTSSPVSSWATITSTAGGNPDALVTNRLSTSISIGDTLYFKNSQTTLSQGWYSFVNVDIGGGGSVDSSIDPGVYLVYVDSTNTVTYRVFYYAYPTVDYDLRTVQKSTNFMYISTGYTSKALAEAASSTSQIVYSNYSGINDAGWTDPTIQNTVNTFLGTNIVITAPSSNYPYDRRSNGYVEAVGNRIFNTQSSTNSVVMNDSFPGDEKYYLVTTTSNANLAANNQNRVIYIDKTGLVDLTK
jgi:hypothetical protein